MLVGVSQRIDVFILAAAEDGAAVEHGPDYGGQGGHSEARQQVVVDEDAGQNCRLHQRGVQLGEVHQEPEEDQGDAEDKETKYQMKGQEPLASLSQYI